ncbi:hypothetical protein H8E07_16100 [bacterium]|nr:hypothetical protein [bacterium]
MICFFYFARPWLGEQGAAREGADFGRVAQLGRQGRTARSVVLVVSAEGVSKGDADGGRVPALEVVLGRQG